MPRKSTVVVSSALSIVLFIGLAAMSERKTAPTKEFLPAVQFVGHDSKVTSPRFVLLKDDAAWSALWAEHTGADAAITPPTRHATPKVDFARFMVVGAFGGARTNTDGEIVSSVVDSEDALRIRYEASTFQTASGFSGEVDSGVKTSPFGLWVIERTDKPIVIEQGTRGLKSSPIEWKQVTRFDTK
jgi:hypothetical protein